MINWKCLIPIKLSMAVSHKYMTKVKRIFFDSFKLIVNLRKKKKSFNQRDTLFVEKERLKHRVSKDSFRVGIEGFANVHYFQ